MTNNTTTSPLVLGALAEGAINPADRVAAGETSEAEIENLTDDLQTDRFYDNIGEDAFMLRCCVDGRGRADGTYQKGASAAGGVFTLLAADMLTTQRFKNGADNSVEYANNVFTHLNEAGYKGFYGDHRADSAAGADESGCGAVDKMAAAIMLIATHGDKIRGYAEQRLGISIADEDHSLIVTAAKKVAKGDIIFGTGNEMLSALEKVATVDLLTGEHKEVAVVINMRSGTTLNRGKLAAAYGERVQAFNYDRWAVSKSLDTISQNIEINEKRKKLLAADYYNLAVTCVLAGPSLRVVSRLQKQLAPVTV